MYLDNAFSVATDCEIETGFITLVWCGILETSIKTSYWYLYDLYWHGLVPNKCPNCNEPNKPDSKFCAKCRMVLTYDAYSETLESERQKEDKITVMEERFNNMQSMLEKLITGLSRTENQQQFNLMAETLVTSGVLKAATVEKD